MGEIIRTANVKHAIIAKDGTLIASSFIRKEAMADSRQETILTVPDLPKRPRLVRI